MIMSCKSEKIDGQGNPIEPGNRIPVADNNTYQKIQIEMMKGRGMGRGQGMSKGMRMHRSDSGMGRGMHQRGLGSLGDIISMIQTMV